MVAYPIQIGILHRIAITPSRPVTCVTSAPPPRAQPSRAHSAVSVHVLRYGAPGPRCLPAKTISLPVRRALAADDIGRVPFRRFSSPFLPPPSSPPGPRRSRRRGNHMESPVFCANARCRLRPPRSLPAGVSLRPETCVPGWFDPRRSAGGRGGGCAARCVERGHRAGGAQVGIQVVLGVFEFTLAVLEDAVRHGPHIQSTPRLRGATFVLLQHRQSQHLASIHAPRAGAATALCWSTPTSIPRRCFNPRPCAGRLLQIRSMTSTPIGRSPVSTCTA